MNLPLVFRRAAQVEFDDAADWYENRRAGQGMAFTTAVRQVLLSLRSNPAAHPEVEGDVREALITRYPYAIYYRPEPHRITVLAIFHTSRDPANWRSRT